MIARCMDCGIPIYVFRGKTKNKRCFYCKKSYDERWERERLKVKSIMQTKDREADIELKKYYNKLGIKI